MKETMDGQIKPSDQDEFIKSKELVYGGDDSEFGKTLLKAVADLRAIVDKYIPTDDGRTFRSRVLNWCKNKGAIHSIQNEIKEDAILLFGLYRGSFIGMSLEVPERSNSERRPDRRLLRLGDLGLCGGLGGEVFLGFADQIEAAGDADEVFLGHGAVGDGEGSSRFSATWAILP